MYIRVYRVLAIILVVLSLIYISALSITSTYGRPAGINEGIIMGGKAFTPPKTSYDPVSTTLSIMSRADKDNDFVEDKLEEALQNKTPSDVVRVIAYWAARPATFGASIEALRARLTYAMERVEDLGANITAGPWLHALVGFGLSIRVSDIRPIITILSALDIDGDGLTDRFLLALDKEYHILNYWSSRQMGVRPWVWEDLGVNGTGVTVVVIDTGIDGDNSAFPSGKIIYWKDYVGDSSGNTHTTPYDDNMHGTHVAGTVAGEYASLDPQGRFVTNFGISEISVSSSAVGYWLRFGTAYTVYYVNTTGTITLRFKWKPDDDGAVGSVGIAFCGNVTYNYCTPQVVAYVDTPNSDTWYTVEYTVDSPSKYGFYYWTFKISTAGTVAMLPIMYYPVTTNYTDKYPYLAGMAPGAKLGGAKVLSYYGGGSTSDISSAIDDVVADRLNYDPPLYIISMSLGGGYDSTLETAVSNAVGAGVVTVVAAGNDGAGQNYAGTGSPSANPYAVTVAAVGALNNITDYSSQGGASQTDSSVTKPDLAAPGGGQVLMIYSADTTYHDDLSNYVTWLWWIYEDVDWADEININNYGYDDSMGIQGTSMATPHVSGVAALLIDALVNHAGLTWDWNSASTALLVKNIMLMSSVETYPLFREYNGTDYDYETYSPTLDKGGKDVHEGYGAIDVYAAIKIALSLAQNGAILPGTVYRDVFRNGTIYSASHKAGTWRFPFGHSAWGSRVLLNISSFKLSNGTTYQPKYGIALYILGSDLANTDLDLYLYRITGDSYGEPIIITSSTQGFGYNESIIYTPASTGINEFIVVVKRAREDSAGGRWALSIGPWMNITGEAPDGSTSGSKVWIGWPVDIKGMSALRADKMVIEVFDNTTGTLLDKITVDMVKEDTQSTASYQYIVPFDDTLVGHDLVFITTYLDSSGNIVSGPVYQVAEVQYAPTPVPEYGGILLAVTVLLIAMLVILVRRSILVR